MEIYEVFKLICIVQTIGKVLVIITFSPPSTIILLIFENPSGASFIRVWIFVDINGISRRPNRLGYDLFTFQLTDEGLKAMGDNGTEYIGDNYCSFSTTGSFNGITCANKAKNDPDYFKKVVKAIK